MSLSVDFYVRVFVRIYTSPAAVKDAGSKLMYVYQSQGCDSFYTQRVGRKVSPQLFALEHLKPHLCQQHCLHGLSLPALPTVICMQIICYPYDLHSTHLMPVGSACDLVIIVLLQSCRICLLC